MASFFLLPLLVTVLAACGGLRAKPPELVVFAASSLADAFDELGTTYRQQQGGTNVVFNYASSAQLAAQLSQGARADLFASADPDQMQVAMAAGRIDELPVVFATNSLVLLLPRDNPAGIKQVSDLAQPGVRLVLATPQTPLRTYSDEVLQKLAANPESEPGLIEAIQANVVSEEDNARQAVAKIALGEADAAFAYRSDKCSELADGTRALSLPPDLAVQAEYAIAVVEGTHNLPNAESFLEFLLSAQGQETLTSWCFGPAPPRP